MRGEKKVKFLSTNLFCQRRGKRRNRVLEKARQLEMTREERERRKGRSASFLFYLGGRGGERKSCFLRIARVKERESARAYRGRKSKTRRRKVGDTPPPPPNKKGERKKKE